jgi:hypothetical protein
VGSVASGAAHTGLLEALAALLIPVCWRRQGRCSYQAVGCGARGRGSYRSLGGGAKGVEVALSLYQSEFFTSGKNIGINKKHPKVSIIGCSSIFMSIGRLSRFVMNIFSLTTQNALHHLRAVEHSHARLGQTSEHTELKPDL